MGLHWPEANTIVLPKIKNVKQYFNNLDEDTFKS